MKRHLHIGALLAILAAIIIFTPMLSSPQQGHLTLLTVMSTNETSRGGTADVYLDIRPGTGNVFIATFPFAKLDTQISTRFANEIACSFLDAPCDQYDFFYTIKADSTIIGGPSAGSALTALTIAMLDNQPIDQGVAITGTINAGGIIGPVGGIHEKVVAAEEHGLHTVIIPRWEETGNRTNATNETFPEGIEVYEATTITETLLVLTGKDYSLPEEELVVPEEYTALMGVVADQLCNRSQQIIAELPELEDNNTLLNSSRSFLEDAELTRGTGQAYSRASYCFSANLRLRELQLQNFSEGQLSSSKRQLRLTIQEKLDDLSTRRLKTFTDLQTKAIVDERLREAADYLEPENVTARDIAYAIERYRSALIWSNFFVLPGERLALNDDHLKDACEQKLGEVEERKGYLTALFGSLIPVDDTDLNKAYAVYGDGDYALCLFKASKAKAQVDVIISSVSLSDEQHQEMIGVKLRVAQQTIRREMEHDRFPVMGYSYYEYAGSLQEDDPYIASLFASYTLELSDLRMYFSPDQSFLYDVFLLLRHPFVLGFIAGVIAMLLLVVQRDPQKKRARRMP